MFGNMIDWAGAGDSAFFSREPGSMLELQKALLAGNDRDPPGSVVSGDAFALRRESLEPVLAVTTFQMRHLRLYQLFPKSQANNTVEEFVQLQSYGNIDGAFTFDEGGLPVEVDSTYERKFMKIRYMGITGRVSDVATMTANAFGSAVAQETSNKTAHFLRNLQEHMYFGSSLLDPGQIDGLEHYITNDAGTAYILDMRGSPLTEEAAIDSALKITASDSYGFPSHMFLAPEASADFSKGFLAKARYNLGQGSSGNSAGLILDNFVTPTGTVSMESDVFLSRDAMAKIGTVAAAGDASNRPGSPTISVAAAAAPNAASQFATSDVGSYFYWVVAYNRAGNSAPVAVNAVALAVAAGDQVTFTIAQGPGPLARYFKIYRSKANGLTADSWPIAKVVAAAAAAVTVVTDNNANLPATTKAFMLQLDSSNLEWKQLSPMRRIPLGQLDTSIRWAQTMYGNLMCKTPKHNIMFKNIGRASGSFGNGA